LLKPAQSRNALAIPDSCVRMEDQGASVTRPSRVPLKALVLSTANRFLSWDFMPKRGPRPPGKIRDRRILLELLREIRLEAGFRQGYVAKSLNRGQSYVSKYGFGERRLDLLELIAVCDVVGILVSDFVARFERRRSA
jgi:hypothetical protein